jgi:asparagine synthase (glutamine-hydrolysing)
MPTYPNNAMSVSIGQAVRSDGCRVMLKGTGGDEFLTGNWFHYAETLSSGQWRQLWTDLRAESASAGARQALWRLWRYGVLGAAPPWARSLRRRLRTASSVLNESDHHFNWLSPRLRAELEARADLPDLDIVHGIRSPARRSLYIALKDGFNGYVHDYVQRTGARAGYEIRSPMYAKDFIDFAFAIPPRLRLRGGLGKHIHREAMRGLLPPLVVERTTKANFFSPFSRILDEHAKGMVNAMLHRGKEFVDAAGLEAVLARYQTVGSGYWTYELWAAFGIANLLDECDFLHLEGARYEHE